MTEAALLVFGIAAIGGAILAFQVIRKLFAPWILSVVHAVLGATGLVLLVLVLLQDPQRGLITAALVLMLAAALGGFYLAYNHLDKRIPPMALLLTHGSVAVVGFVVLGWAVLGA